MSSNSKSIVGLYLGKFAPLHLGHEFVISKALEIVDSLVILIYPAPELSPIPLSKRAKWLRKINPAIEVIECPDGPTEVTYELDGMKGHEDYILNVLGNRKIDYFFSSEPYGEHMSKALNCIDYRVDQNRIAFPISSTELRVDIFRHRLELSPHVYFDHRLKVSIIGAPSTGKTTLTEALAKLFDVNFMPEFGREYWNANQVSHRLSEEQLVELAEMHLDMEIKTAHEGEGLFFVDTNALTTYVYSLYYHGQAFDRLINLAECAKDRYDIFVLCHEDIPFDDTEDRSGPDSRTVIQSLTLRELQNREIPYVLASGSIEERIAIVRKAIEEYQGGQ